MYLIQIQINPNLTNENIENNREEQRIIYEKIIRGFYTREKEFNIFK
jgi:hypothetical protein